MWGGDVGWVHREKKVPVVLYETKELTVCVCISL